jgi:hypothetical protein
VENVGILKGHLVCFTAIWYILRPFGIFSGCLVYFFLFWFVVQKNLATLVFTCVTNGEPMASPYWNIRPAGAAAVNVIKNLASLLCN